MIYNLRQIRRSYIFTARAPDLTSEKEKVIDAIVKLIRETQEGKITWSPKEPPASLKLDANTSVDIVYEAAYKNRRLRLYEED